MKRNYHMITLAVSAMMAMLQLTIIQAAEIQPLQIAPSQETRIRNVLSLKTEAMKLSGMRSPNGVLGKQVESLMDEIAAATTDVELRTARNNARTDIRAKILLWATDRKDRLADYQRFAKEYLNRPPTDKEAMEYFYRVDPSLKGDPEANQTKPRWPPREGTWAPYQVSKADTVEQNRLMMEYSYFMPPTGRDFDHQGTRYNMAKALRDLSSVENSYIVFSSDWDIWMNLVEAALADNALRNTVFHNQIAIDSLRAIPNEHSFELLAAGIKLEPIKEVIRNQFINRWEQAVTFFELRDDILKNHAAWIALAKKDWKEPAEQEFARLLQALPSPGSK